MTTSPALLFSPQECGTRCTLRTLVLALLLSSMCAATVQTVTPAVTDSDFGTVAVGSTGTVTTLSYQLGSVSAPQFALKYGSEFNLVGVACAGASSVTCSVSLSFSPRSAGLRQDALLIETTGGAVITRTLLHGIGSGVLAAGNPGTINTVAGMPGIWGFAGDNNLSNFANFASPQNMAIDGAGNFFIADSVNQVIREVMGSTRVVKTVAGTPYRAGSGGDGGPATSAQLNNPSGVAVDGAGNLYIADSGNNRVRRVDAVSGVITTVAGGATARSGTDGLGDGGAATGALLNTPLDIAVSPAGHLFIADSGDNLVRRVDAVTQTITVAAGGGTGSGGSNALGDGALATAALLRYPTGVALDAAGNLYVADKGNNVVRQINAVSNIISTVAGSGAWGYCGDNGLASNACLSGPIAVRTDAAGDLYIADYGNSVIRMVSASSHSISTFAGNSSSGFGGDGGNATQATLSNPTGVALDATGKVYIVDCGNNIIRSVTTVQQLTYPTTNVGLVSPAQRVTLINTGNQSVTLASITLGTAFVQQLSGGVDCSAGLAVAPGGTCQIAVAFAPVSAGSSSGQLAVTSSGSVSLLKVALSGSGTGSGIGTVAVAPTSLSFGNQNVGTASATQTVTLTNNTGGALSLASIFLSGANSGDFQITATSCGPNVSSGSSCTVSVLFNPLATGVRAGSLVFNDTASNGPQTVTLSGTGLAVPKLAVTASALTFASQGISAQPAVQRLTVSNSGTGTLNLTSFTVGGANASDFLETGNCSSLSAGATCSISIWFAPTAAGARTATLSIANSGSSGPQVIALSGTAVATSNPYKFALMNGNFELGSLASWNVAGTAAISSVAHTGSYGVSQNAPSTNTFTYQDVHGLTAGQTYLVTAWAKASSPTWGELWVHDTNGNNLAGSPVVLTSSWQQISTSFTATGTAAMRIHLVEFPSQGTVYWDDVNVSLAVSNPGFESGSLAGWNIAGQSATSAGGHSGAYAVAEQAASGTTFTFQDVLGLIPGQSYVISAWVRSSANLTGNAQLWLHDTTGQSLSGGPISTTTAWQPVSVLFTATNTGAVRIHLCKFAGAGTVYWDDVSISEAVNNAHFEAGSLTPWNVAGNGSLSATSHSGNTGVAEQAGTLTYQDVAGLIPGQSYLLSAWVKSSASSANSVAVWVHDTQGANVAGVPVTATTSWQRVNTIFTATATGAVRVHLYDISGAVTVYWDDVTISAN